MTNSTKVEKLQRTEADIRVLKLRKKPILFHEPVNYKNRIVPKPWGYEFLMFDNQSIAIWVLSIKEYAKTSMHSHPNKKTTLSVIRGEAICRSLSKELKLEAGQSVIFEKGVFHSTKSLNGDLIVIEIETPVDKQDLVRYQDQYGRENKSYEDIFIQNNLSEFHHFYLENSRKTIKEFDVTFSLVRIKDIKELFENLSNEEIVFLCDGKVLCENENMVFLPGDIILEGSLDPDKTIIKEEVKILKIIY